MTPAVGRIVHYVSRGSADGQFPSRCRAAVVTEVGYGDRVGLAVLNPSGMFFHSLAENGAEYFDASNPREGVVVGCPGPHGPGTWHWPGRV